jgi:hypothetical protein
MEIKFATITSPSTLMFDGDTEETPINRYFKNALYTPNTGDRVYFLVSGNTKILQGKVAK